MIRKTPLKNNPNVSIITVCLNSEKYIERAVKSILSQTYKNIEYVVIDGGSTDGTLNILNKYKSSINCLISEQDKGIYDAMNKGIRKSTGDIIYFLNSDDYLYNERAVEDAVHFFSNKKADLVYGDCLCRSQFNNEVHLKKHFHVAAKRHFLKGTIVQSAIFFKRSCFLKAGYFKIRYKIAADHRWYLKALFKKRLRAAHISQIISVFQEGGASSNKELCSLETESIHRLYFSPFDILTGKSINFLLYGDIFRVAVRAVLKKKGYESLRRKSREILTLIGSKGIRYEHRQ